MTVQQLRIGTGVASSLPVHREYPPDGRSADGYQLLPEGFFYLDTGGANGVQIFDAASTTRYQELYDGLSLMKSLDEEDSMAIDEDTHRSACSVLNLLNHRHIQPPKVFAHGGDAVVFTWKQDDTSLHLTVSDGIASLGLRTKSDGPVTIGHAYLERESVAKFLPYLKSTRPVAGTASAR